MTDPVRSWNGSSNGGGPSTTQLLIGAVTALWAVLLLVLTLTLQGISGSISREDAQIALLQQSEAVNTERVTILEQSSQSNSQQLSSLSSQLSTLRAQTTTAKPSGG